MRQTRINIEVNPDGSRNVSFYSKAKGWMPAGRLMPPISQATAEASPGIQGWSHPRGKVQTGLYDKGATILSFSDYCAKRVIPNYPRTS